jgi:hypothetical protein
MLICGFGIAELALFLAYKIICKPVLAKSKMGKTEIISKYKHVLTVKYEVNLLK